MAGTTKERGMEEIVRGRARGHRARRVRASRKSPIPLLGSATQAIEQFVAAFAQSLSTFIFLASLSVVSYHFEQACRHRTDPGSAGGGQETKSFSMLAISCFSSSS